ncbi:unnamed protein product [Cladocopium goreaui]|uniref:Uncharacterized protein n=1 Tax=Cladocopium goreaui TaxID=2562237 RepID=A0A9P1BGR4_9DINO|nr:unnamed protein product [Cladocopium goreaui]
MAAVEAAVPTVLPNSEGERTTPSVVAYSKDGEILVGTTAKRQAALNPLNTFGSVKRWFGRTFAEVESDARSVPYHLVDKDGKARLDCPNLQRQLAPEEVSAQVLRKLQRDASVFLNADVKKAVITVPAYFDDAQRQATKAAGTLAGLEVMRVCNEPTMAALAYGLDQKNSSNLLVFDLGGGTFDVSVMEAGDGVCEVLATNGDTQLGGDDFDRRILDFLLQRFREANDKMDLREDKQAMQRLLEASEKAKVELSSLNEVRISVPFITADEDGPKHVEEVLTREHFEELSEDLVQRLADPVLKALKDSRVRPRNLHEVILVGGSTRIPAVQNLARELTAFKPINMSISADEVVALGASVQAAMISGEVKDIMLIDVTPLTLGVETEGGVFSEVLPRGSAVPWQAKRIFTTSADAQDAIEVVVLQGERPLAKDNKKLGMFRLDDIPAAPKGVPKIEVTFDINVEGILTVSAKDWGTSQEKSIRIEETGTSGTGLRRHVRLWLALCQLVSAVSANCGSLYESRAAMWRSMSQAMSVYTPVKHRPEWYWKEIFERRQIEPPGHSGYEETWLDLLFGQAHDESLACQVNEGRHWELELDVQKLYDAVRISDRPSFMIRAANAFNIALPTQRSELPQHLRLCLCVPATCTAEEVVETVFAAQFAVEFMGDEPKSMLNGKSFRDVVEISELRDWSAINLDFVIGGVDSCGTASLHLNLEKHSEVAFLTSDVDYFFTNKLAHRVLPLKAQVDEYNALVLAAREAKERLTGVTPLVGACVPALFSTALARIKMALIPNLKLVMILCDPLGRLEKGFMHHHLCFADLEDAQRQGLAARASRHGSCYDSSAALLYEKEGELQSFWEDRQIAPHLPAVLLRFYERILFLHQEELRRAPADVFSSLAGFLGVKAFPDIEFPRYNSIGGHRTDLCRNMTLVRALQQNLEADYQMQEKMMQLSNPNRSLMARLRRRLTRCHDIDRVKDTASLEDREVQRILDEAEEKWNEDEEAKFQLELRYAAANLLEQTDLNLVELGYKAPTDARLALEPKMEEVKVCLAEAEEQDYFKLMDAVDSLRFELMKLGLRVYGKQVAPDGAPGPAKPRREGGVTGGGYILKEDSEPYDDSYQKQQEEKWKNLRKKAEKMYGRN